MSMPSVSTSQVRQFLGQPGRAGHIVQFYESDRFLIDNVCHFAAAGIAAGDPVLVIATPAHRTALRERLERGGFDVNVAGVRGLYTECDASELLAEFMVGSQLDPVRFQERVGSLVASTQARRPDGQLRAFGEMVDLLWQSGNRDGAVRLEELWSSLAETQPFSLLCAYAMRNFETPSDSARFDALCTAHAFVIPSEGHAGVDEADERLREITFLQQRSLALANEIAQRKELEQALRDALTRATEACARAERMVRYNEVFTRMLGHELRNPLNAIVTTAQYLARTRTDARTSTAVARIAISSRRMARMIEQLLAFTQIRVGEGLPLQRTRVDLMDLCDGIKGELEADYPGCIIVTQARGESVGDVDYHHMLDVLSNLMGNALDHGTPGTPVTVAVDGTDTDRLILEVTNSGAVPPDVLPVMFEPFRGDAKGHHSQALGLGLYITRQIVTAHGGELTVDSNELDGTTFRVGLPRSFEGAVN